MKVAKMPNGSARKYTSVGSYPIFYVAHNKVRCPHCALINEKETETILQEVNWENGSLLCDECGTRIESAYAEDED